VGLKEMSDNAQGLIGKKRLKRSVEILVERRHQIVHEGDINRHGRLRRIDGLTTAKRLLNMRLIVGACEILIYRFSRKWSK
jgi:hypothetical protein